TSTTPTTPGPPNPACSPRPQPCTTPTTNTFVWDSSAGLPEAIGVGAYAYIYGPSGLPTEQLGPNGSILYYLQNRQGSTIALTDTKGHVVARYSYGPYGSLICGANTPPTMPLGNLPPCLPSPPSSPQPPAQCLPASAHSPVGPPPCLVQAISANPFL
ncbi:hypothetical protein B1B_08271, partial [mine drainage metagenome]